MAKKSKSIMNMNISDIPKQRFFKACVLLVVSILFTWLALYFYGQVKTVYCEPAYRCWCSAPLHPAEDFKCEPDPVYLKTHINKEYVYATALSTTAAASSAGLALLAFGSKKRR